jgi:hypothetical protein
MMTRLALFSLILGTALALVPVASSMVLSDGGGGSGGGLAATPGGVDPATQAVLLRSKALADDYGANGVTFHTDVLGGNGGSSAAPTAAGDSFDWNPVLAATLAGMLLLAAAATAVTRRKHRLSY